MLYLGRYLLVSSATLVFIITWEERCHHISSKEDKLVAMNPMNLSRRRSPLALPFNKLHSRTSLRNHLQRRKSKNIRKRMKRLRSDMQEISREQGKIKEGQRQVREKFEAVESECELLRKETNIIMQQSMSTQLRLAFMFQILKARENHDLDQAAKLTSALRELIARENQQKETM